MTKITWIGTGVMGRSMAGHLARNGHSLTLYNRSAEKAARTAEEIGGQAASSLGEALRDCQVVCLMVGYPRDVEGVFHAEDGIFAKAPRGALVIDLTTSSPTLACALADRSRKLGLRLLDAPVSGGDAGARKGTLSVMVGGEEADFAEAHPLLACFGSNIVHLGPAGSGQHAKAANQIAVAGATAAMTEALVYARKVGLDPEKLLQAISAGAAGSWQLQNMASRVLRKDYAPGFYVKHFIKDMDIVSREMADRGTRLRMLEAVLAMYRDLAAQGHDEDGTQSLIQLYGDED